MALSPQCLTLLAALLLSGVCEAAVSRTSIPKLKNSTHPAPKPPHQASVKPPKPPASGWNEVNLHTLYPAMNNRSHISSGRYYHANRSYHTSRYGSNSRGTNGTVRAFVNRLDQVKRELIAADHDYSGHRARAVHSLHQAIYQMEPTTAHHTTMQRYQTTHLNAGAGSRTGGRGRSALPQTSSDAHLRNGLQELVLMENQMASMGTSQSDAVAVNHVQSAIRELRIALGVR